MMNDINIPGSKSIAARALVCRLLGGHDTVLTNLPDCGDTRGMLRLTDAVRQAQRKGSDAESTPQTVDIGEGGTTLRFGMAACASIPGLDIILTGSPRLMERPHDTLIRALRDMGADITPLPAENALRIRGRELSGGTIRLDGSVSSQYMEDRHALPARRQRGLPAIHRDDSRSDARLRSRRLHFSRLTPGDSYSIPNSRFSF